MTECSCCGLIEIPMNEIYKCRLCRKIFCKSCCENLETENLICPNCTIIQRVEIFNE